MDKYLDYTKPRNGWYKRKNYPHFDVPLKYKNAKFFAYNFGKDPQYAFLPMIQFVKEEKRFRTIKVLENGKIVKRINSNLSITKKRIINYPAHKDGYIYAYYAYKLSKLYENKIADSNLDNCICGYRKSLGTNINVAEQVFRFIKEKQNCLCIAFDIKGFFDNLSHEYLKKQWKKLLGVDKLPSDHFKIFNSITKFASILREKLPLDDNKQLSRPVCTPKMMRKLKDCGSIIINEKDRGIPQGTQISAFLSNVYMFEFDKAMKKYIDSLDGIYKRYADDILIVVPLSSSVSYKNIQYWVKDFLFNVGGQTLELNNSKTEIVVFRNGLISQKESNHKHFQYLGFTYDGLNVLLRSGTLSKYWRKMIKGARRKVIFAKKDKLNRGVFKTSAYHLYSHLGKKNNFYSYVRKAHAVFDAYFPEENKIKKQLKKHIKVLKKELSGIKTTKHQHTFSVNA